MGLQWEVELDIGIQLNKQRKLSKKLQKSKKIYEATNKLKFTQYQDCQILDRLFNILHENNNVDEKYKKN